MDINDRIKKINEYFKGLNIDEDATVVLVKFPDKWKVFDKDELHSQFSVDTAKKDGIDGIFFVGETSNGIDSIFDAIEEVIRQNKTFEEKTTLLEQKAQELSNLFITEPLEKLKTLEFTFKVRKPARKPKNGVTEENESKESVNKSKSVQIVEPSDENKLVNEEEKPKKQVKTNKTPIKNNNDDSDVMSFMKEITEGGKKK